MFASICLIDISISFVDNADMEVTVLFTTQLKAALGRSDQDLSLADEATVKDAIDSLAKQHPDHFAKLVMADGKLLPSILLSVNDQQVEIDATLKHGDTLTLLSAISGG